MVGDGRGPADAGLLRGAAALHPLRGPVRGAPGVPLQRGREPNELRRAAGPGAGAGEGSAARHREELHRGLAQAPGGAIKNRGEDVKMRLKED